MFASGSIYATIQMLTLCCVLAHGSQGGHSERLTFHEANMSLPAVVEKRTVARCQYVSIFPRGGGDDAIGRIAKIRVWKK